MMTTGDKHQENTAKIRWGAHFKATREAMHLSEKDAASRLHLNPNMITVIETETFKSDTPVIFMRGYVRSYARLLNISDKHINQALLDLGLVDQSTLKATPLRTKKVIEHSNNNSFTGWSTTLVVIVLLGLVGMWWNTHTRNAVDNGTSPTLSMQSPNTGNVTNSNATPGDPTPKELVQQATAPDNTTSTTPTAANTPVPTPTDTQNTVAHSATPTTTAPVAVNTNTNPAVEGNMPPANPNAANQPTNPITAGNGPSFDLPSDAAAEANPATEVTNNTVQPTEALTDASQPETNDTPPPVKKHKSHHKAQELAGEDMALPEPGLVPEPGDLDPNETN